MANEIISHNEMCRREGISLQKGMNFRIRDNHSVILMSVRPGAPYEDEIRDGGTTIIYEGHDVARSKGTKNPKRFDQPERTSTGRLTENGLFHEAAQNFKASLCQPQRVRVYEKIKSGIWSYNGIFHLVDSWQQRAGSRQVFKFKLEAVEGEEDFSVPVPQNPEARRIIPTQIKLEVWKRDAGKCTRCGSAENLHFDHIIPYSRGGSSETAENVQLLCGRHNLQKHDRIE